ncbi:MAG: 50S ribosomal protein L22 [Methanomassiliicoccales archaeon]|nr:50S ribosomal protein L22 [Methanomassiliicoccales archaeon]NYT15688.1 50S ribosomal protein L22 [Methanomassiliicoccales archaeon]
MVGYTMETDPDSTSRAIGKELPISPKHSREICSMVRGMEVSVAVDVLNEIIELKRAVPFKRYKKCVSHKKGTGPGRYPQKAAKAILGVIESAMSNAEYKGLGVDSMRIKVIAAHLGRTQQGWMPRAYGRATPFDHQTVNVEVILEEME